MWLKNIILVMFGFCAVFTPFIGTAFGQEIPQLLSSPVVLLDEGGNPLPDGSTMVTVRLLDAAGNMLFEEEHNAVVTKGVAKLMIGEGFVLGTNMSEPSQGVPIDIFDPSDPVHQRLFVEVEAEGYKPQDVSLVTSVPYAFYASEAMSVADKSIQTDDIAPLAITKDLLDQELLDAIFATAIPDDRLSSTVLHRDELDARLSGENVLRASQVQMDVTLSNSGARNVAAVLTDIDQRLDALRDVNIEDARSTFNVRLTEESVVRETAITAERTSRENGDEALGRALEGERVARGEAIVEEARLRGVADANLATDLEQEIRNRVSAVFHESGIRLENDAALQEQINTVHAAIPLQPQRAYAWGRVGRFGGAFGGYNVATVSRLSLPGSAWANPGYSYRVDFSTPAETDNVVINVTVMYVDEYYDSQGSYPVPTPTITNVDRTGFEVRCITNHYNYVSSGGYTENNREAAACAFSWIAYTGEEAS